MLKLPEELCSPEISHYLEWLNYWFVAAAQAIGFPDPLRDADLLSRARRTATGGWIVRLSDAPLDLDNPALLRAYERFPEIGGYALRHPLIFANTRNYRGFLKPVWFVNP